MCFFYSFRNMAIFVITINMLGVFETRAGQPETSAKPGVNVTQQSAESDQSHHQDGHGDCISYTSDAADEEDITDTNRHRIDNKDDTS